MSTVMQDYSLDVVQEWDNASWNFKDQCDRVNARTTVSQYLDGHWGVKVWWATWIETVIESIDWVGTKVQIYTNRFNFLVRELEEWRLEAPELLTQSIELWERMLHDLIAMNVDDLRNWEMAVAVTNIIDINHLKWIRWKVFSDSMWQALYNVILELDIAMTAWETAILWEPQKVGELQKVLALFWWELTAILYLRFPGSVKQQIRDILEDLTKKVEIISKDLEFNIGWTWLWVMWKEEKLVKLEAGQAIVYLWERSTENWIIWPRSNGITAIRKHMENLAWEWWENLSFEEFLGVVWNGKSDLLPPALKEECAWLKMWDIATWKTTVFNPFVSRKLLGGLEDAPIVSLSSIIHVTWNPLRKISQWLHWREDLCVNLQITNIKMPQIIQILQILWEIPDKEAIWSWNMWVPYVVICDKKDVQKIKEEADKDWIPATKIWTVEKRENMEGEDWTIKWVWVGNSVVTL